MKKKIREISFLIKGSELEKEVEIVSSKTSIGGAIKDLANNWDEFGIDKGLFGEIESLRIVLRKE